MTLKNVWMLAASLIVASGCIAEPLPEDEALNTDSSALSTDNALTLNAITLNALTLNALTLNALTLNALTLNSMPQGAIQAIQDPSAQGALNRELVRYMVACAFKPSQSLNFSWTDEADLTHNEHYVGQLGLAPQWYTGVLGQEGQHIVTACLGAKVNYYGTKVTISVRSGKAPLRLHPNDDELDAYSKIEGAFWGNLWAPTPYINACYNTANVDNSRDHLRDCAAGHLNADGSIEQCGIINIVGSCANACKKYNASRGYYEDCRKQPGVNNQRTDLVITTALPD